MRAYRPAAVPPCRSHFGQALFMGWILGSVFWQLELSDFILRFSVMLFAAIYLGFASLAEIPITLINRTVSGKLQQMNGLHGH